MDCSPPGSSIHGIFQARVPEWGAIAFSDGCWAPFIYLCLVLSVTNLTSSALILFGKLNTWAIKWVNATTARNHETEGLVYCLLQKVLSPSPKDPGIRFVWLCEELPSTESLPEISVRKAGIIMLILLLLDVPWVLNCLVETNWESYSIFSTSLTRVEIFL